MNRDDAVRELARLFVRAEAYVSRDYVEFAEIAVAFADALAMAERAACTDEIPSGKNEKDSDSFLDAFHALDAAEKAIRGRDAFPYEVAYAAVRRTP